MLPMKYSLGWMTKYTLEHCQWESLLVAIPLVSLRLMLLVDIP